MGRTDLQTTPPYAVELNPGKGSRVGIRRYHTSTPSRQDKESSIIIPPQLHKNLYINSYSDNILNVYLEGIGSIINNNYYSSYQKQSLIENYWLDLIKDQYENLEYVKSKHSNELIHKLLRIKKTLDYAEERGYIKKIFPNIHKILNNKKIFELGRRPNNDT